MSESVSNAEYGNKDLLPVPPEKRTWTKWDLAALWIGMAVCIPTYQLASSLINSGMSWWQALLTVLLGNVIVLVPLALNGHAGTAHGIPFPVMLRASFGILGSNVAALMRAIVACGWFGIQTWIGGAAIHGILVSLGLLNAENWAQIGWLGITLPQLLCFLAFWAMNVAIILKGIECIRWLEGLGAPFLLIVGLALLAWAWYAADGFGPMLNEPSKLTTTSSFLAVFFPGLTAMVGFWGTLALNIPDFSRYARSQRDQVLGQIIGLPGTMALFAFIGIAVTSATWEPGTLLTKFPSWAVGLWLFALLIATLTTNLAANVVSPANDFSNLAPKLISFKMGGVLTGIIGVLIFPWKILDDPSEYVLTFLVGYSALLGPIGGIMIADYWVIRRRQLDIESLYRFNGAYRYCFGFSLVAIGVLAISIVPSIPGFLARFDSSLDPGFLLATWYDLSWFTGFAMAFFVYIPLRKAFPKG